MFCGLLMKESESRLVQSNSLQPHELYSPWNSPGQNTGVGSLSLSRESSQPTSPTLQADSLPAEPQEKPKNSGMGSLSLLQGIFPTQGSNPGLPHCRCILYQLSHHGSLIYSHGEGNGNPCLYSCLENPMDAGAW